ncbi:hypothetical protein [Nocardia transvalensis]|uniref:hypothetical protein n=1 Tax=Nocardia transvalensis TaxID=37333 RepID=UPI001895B828|nr:hypothetical protein [Nocardia transvalensis]MBF6332460.1 hypothetical protein [Nocardia transvalensis]
MNQDPIVVPMMTAPKAQACDNYGHQFESIVELRGTFRHQGRPCHFMVVYLDETTVSRREFRGPVVAGEHAYLVPQPVVIAAWPQNRPLVIDVADGDVISILGRCFRIQDDRALYDPRLVRVEDWPSPCTY